MDELWKVGKTLEVNFGADLYTPIFIPRDPTMFPLISKEINIITHPFNSFGQYFNFFQEYLLQLFKANISEITIELLISVNFQPKMKLHSTKIFGKKRPILWRDLRDDTLAGTCYREFISFHEINSFISKTISPRKAFHVGICTFNSSRIFFSFSKF